MAMKRTSKSLVVKSLTFAFLALTVAALAYLFYVHQVPVVERKSVVLASYQHKATYDYVAELKPNIIYNKTYLRPNEGVLYSTITNRINVTFTYEFASSVQPEGLDVKLRGVTARVESPDRWTKSLSDDEASKLLNLKASNAKGSVGLAMNVDCATLKQLVNAIDKELGVYSSTFNVHVVPEISVSAKIAGKKVLETFTPQLTISFRTERGGYITLEGLEQVKTSEIKEVVEVRRPDIESHRNLSYLLVAMAVIGLTISTPMYLKSVRRTKKSMSARIRRLLEDYKDMMAEALGSLPEGHVVNLNSLEDLARVAEVLTKPIVKVTDEEGELYCVIDGGVRYQCRLKKEQEG